MGICGRHLQNCESKLKPWLWDRSLYGFYTCSARARDGSSMTDWICSNKWALLKSPKKERNSFQKTRYFNILIIKKNRINQTFLSFFNIEELNFNPTNHMTSIKGCTPEAQFLFTLPPPTCARAVADCSTRSR